MARDVRRLLPKTRMGVFTFVLVVLWILKSLLLSTSIQSALSPGQQISLDLFVLLFAIPAVYYSWKLSSLLKRKLLWKIRRRLILAHVFIGAIPVLLVVLILYVSALLVYYQLSYFLILNQIGIYSAQIHALSLSLRAGTEQSIGNSPIRGGTLHAVLERESKYVLATFPSASIIMRAPQDPGSNEKAVVAARNVRRGLLAKYQIPGWVENREFFGLVVEDLEPDLYRDVERPAEDGGRGKLYLRSVVFSDFRQDSPFSIEISVPVDRYLLDRLKAALGQDLLLADHVATSSLNVMLQNTEILQRNVLCATFDLKQERQSLGRPVWSVLLFPVSWVTGGENGRADTEVLFVELSTSKLIQNVFRPESNVSKTILDLLKVVVGFFLVVEIVSLIIGIMLTKSITSAVHNLDRGTEFIKRGDFSHRVVVKADDQLGALAKSFNQMTEYVQALVKERVQKERLERELEIAKEVQEQLFPQQAPQMKRLEVTGLCLPARVVSGDYYDFLQLSPQCLGIAIGDICGKGISAALLMANLQATLRSDVLNLALPLQPVAQANGDAAVSRLMRLLNHQIYSFTSSNKFASLFYGVYDDSRLTLTYCNAGHNPPLYFGDGGFQRLTVGGTVVGIFPDAEYEHACLTLRPGDLFVAYTDGIVESVNEYGEEFGEQRLIQLIQRNRTLTAADIQKVIVEEVVRWSFEEERDDDMTLIIARIL